MESLSPKSSFSPKSAMDSLRSSSKSAMDSLKSRSDSAMDSLKSSSDSAMDSLRANSNSAMDSLRSLSPESLSPPTRPLWQKVVLGLGVFAVVLYACYKYLWPPLNQALNTPKVAPPAKKPSPPPKVKAEPTPNDTGFCYVGEWQGVRSCVPLKGGTCAGDLYPTAAECSDPNLR